MDAGRSAKQGDGGGCKLAAGRVGGWRVAPFRWAIEQLNEKWSAGRCSGRLGGHMHHGGFWLSNRPSQKENRKRKEKRKKPEKKK